MKPLYIAKAHSKLYLYFYQKFPMRTMSVTELKTHFSEVLRSVEGGEKIAITDGPKKEVKALLVPNTAMMAKRKLGLLKGKASFKISKDFKISEEEFSEL